MDAVFPGLASGAIACHPFGVPASRRPTRSDFPIHRLEAYAISRNLREAASPASFFFWAVGFGVATP